MLFNVTVKLRDSRLVTVRVEERNREDAVYFIHRAVRSAGHDDIGLTIVDVAEALPSPHALACAFLEELRCSIRPEDLHLVFERNEAEPDKLICHSHDFCDANQCMLDAFARLGCSVEFEPLNDKLGELIEAAWAMALPRDGSRLSEARGPYCVQA